MAIKDVLKVSHKTFVDPRIGLNYDELKEPTRVLCTNCKGVLSPIPAKPAVDETVEEAMKRFNVKEQDLQDISYTYLFFAGLFLVFGLGLFGFGIYLLLNSFYAAAILAIAFTVFLLSQAFKYHFWHFQIKFRKLGCTFAEWKRGKPFAEGEPKA